MRRTDNLVGTYTEKRILKAIELIRAYPDDWDVLVFSGGYVASRDIQTRSGAALMFSHFFSLVGNDYGFRVLTETYSLDTFQNVGNTLHVLKSERIAFPEDKAKVSFTVVTERHHGNRFLITFRAHGYTKVKIVDAGYALTLKETLMEWIFYLVHLFDPKGEGLLARKNQARRLAANGNRL